MRISDWSSDVCSSDLTNVTLTYSHDSVFGGALTLQGFYYDFYALYGADILPVFQDPALAPAGTLLEQSALSSEKYGAKLTYAHQDLLWRGLQVVAGADYLHRSEEHTSELQSLMRISYAVFCLKKKKTRSLT